MKKNILLLLTLLVVPAACSPKAESTHPAWSYDAVVYELNMRQYTPEGTFAAAQKELPRLKELGVDVLWLMPVYPIGVKERKGVLGSYYAISDYCDINPEYGKMADFDAYLAEAHKEGFKVILDWVANHTSPDAKWINEKPLDWYERDSLGNTIVQYDWTGEKPVVTSQYLAVPERKALYDTYAGLLKFRNDNPEFFTKDADFKWYVTTANYPGKYIYNTSGGKCFTVAGNFGKGSRTLAVDPPVNGTFYNYFDRSETYSGDKFDITLGEGEWRLLVNF
uniref:Glycosyl hydrolase family 13 catalytic domain-containing protein n=1 Tax=uncultured prokaryote TaxID=198431 RepID=A0A0H5Q2Q4_9ZZZZ|nr:hypothetical protein [uncultured prokaryote]